MPTVHVHKCKTLSETLLCLFKYFPAVIQKCLKCPKMAHFYTDIGSGAHHNYKPMYYVSRAVIMHSVRGCIIVTIFIILTVTEMCYI